VLGTLDNTPLDISVSGRRAIRILPHVLTASIVGGHPSNEVGKDAGGAVVAGGGTADAPNKANGDFVFIGSGEGNEASGAHSAIAGGWDNKATGNRSFIGGGRNNQANLAGGAIGGGYSNIVNNTYATVAGGYNNLAEGYASSVAGGWANAATGEVSNVAGGMQNRAMADASSVGGGFQNTAAGYGARVGGGQNNSAIGDFSFVGGGTNNVARGAGSAIPAGSDNEALADYAIAAGRGAVAIHPNTFVFSDGQNGQFASSAPNQVLMRASGGVGIGTSTPSEQLEVAGNIRADSIIAKSFVGDGSGLTGIEQGLKPNSIQPQHLADGFVLPADKIQGGALTRNAALGGVLQGTLDKAELVPGSITRNMLADDARTIAPGSITADQLADGVIPVVPDLGGLADAIEESVNDVWKTGGNSNVQAGKEFIGTTDTSPIVASVHKNSLVFSGDPKAPASTTRDGQVLLMAPNNVGINNNAPDEALTVGGNIKASGAVKAAGFVGDGSGLTNLPIPALPQDLLTAASNFEGDVTGPAAALKLRTGIVGIDHLTPALRTQIEAGASKAAADAMVAEVKTLRGEFDTKLNASQAAVDQRIADANAENAATMLQQVDTRISAATQAATAGFESGEALLGKVDEKIAVAQNQMDERIVLVQQTAQKDLLEKVNQQVAEVAQQATATGPQLMAQVDQKLGAVDSKIDGVMQAATVAQNAAAEATAAAAEANTNAAQVDSKIQAAQNEMDERILLVQQAAQKDMLAQMNAQVAKVAQQATATGPELMAQVDQKLGTVDQKVIAADAKAEGALQAATEAKNSAAGVIGQVDAKIQNAQSQMDERILLVQQAAQKDMLAQMNARVAQVAQQATATGPELMAQVDQKLGTVDAKINGAIQMATEAKNAADGLLGQVDQKLGTANANAAGALQAAADAKSAADGLLGQVDQKIAANQAAATQGVLGTVDSKIQAAQNQMDERIILVQQASEKELIAKMNERVAQVAQQATATGPQILAQVDQKLALIDQKVAAADAAARSASTESGDLLTQVDQKIAANTQGILGTVDEKLAVAQSQMDERIVLVQQGAQKDLLATVDQRIATVAAQAQATGPQLLAQMNQKLGLVDQQVADAKAVANNLSAAIDGKIASSQAALTQGVLGQIDSKIATAQVQADERVIALQNASSREILDQVNTLVDQRVAAANQQTSAAMNANIVSQIAANKGASAPEMLAQMDQKIALAKNQLDTRILDVQAAAAADLLASVDQKVAGATAGIPNTTALLGQVDQRITASQVRANQDLLAQVDQKIAGATANLPNPAALMAQVDEKVATAAAAVAPPANLMQQVDQRINTASTRTRQDMLAAVDQRIATAANQFAKAPDAAMINQSITDAQARNNQQLLAQLGAQMDAKLAGSRGGLPAGIRVQDASDGPNVILGNSANEIGGASSSSVIAGGGSKSRPNRITSNYSTISGGRGNSASAITSSIGGGENNTAQGIGSTIGGGNANQTSGEFATISGGADNKAFGKFSSVGGGYGNQATGTGATVIGGEKNEAAGDFSVAAGRNARALHPGSIVLADSGDSPVASSAANQLIARASGGAFIFSSTSSGVSLPAGSGSWNNLSDRNAKKDLEAVDGRDILAKVEALPIYKYQYKTQDGVPHMGPVAQDFSAAFALGQDDRHINTLDADGVALAAIQGLAQRLSERDAQVEMLEKQVLTLAEALQTLMEK